MLRRILPRCWAPPSLRATCIVGICVAGQCGLGIRCAGFQGDVLDEAGILSAADEDALLQRIRALRDSSGIWAAVYVARSLQQDVIENAAVTAFEKWQLGQAGKDMACWC